MARSRGGSLLGAVFSLSLGLVAILTIQSWMPYWLGFWQGFAEILLKTL